MFSFNPKNESFHTESDIPSLYTKDPLAGLAKDDDGQSDAARLYFVQTPELSNPPPVYNPYPSSHPVEAVAEVYYPKNTPDYPRPSYETDHGSDSTVSAHGYCKQPHPAVRRLSQQTLAMDTSSTTLYEKSASEKGRPITTMCVNCHRRVTTVFEKRPGNVALAQSSANENGA
ncbi:hypothetical protein H4R34_000554 [Dimargaris verticillata]|uniref:LITAF domain-containing protein n=1 Tax=Dimargaris verticillata TaxID=2761393 RepID=A0A9W8EF96_9FUNG|nr:hypothetical protein H4R34_000554 [Dimargaris verticillata]